MELSPSFLEIATTYKAVFFDSYGVLKVAGGKVDGGPETLAQLSAAGIEIRVLTNDASRSQSEQASRFQELGYDKLRSRQIITSGMMAKFFLREKITRGKVAYLGTEASARYVLDAGCTAIPVAAVENPQEIEALVFLDDEGFDWNTALNAAVNLLRQQPMAAIVANSDKLYPVSENHVAIATGGIASLIEQVVGREFIHFGKPDSQMFNYAFEDLNRDDSYRKSDVLMVGDTLSTDIVGGNKFGIKTCLVLTGNTTLRHYRSDISRRGIVPDFICTSIGS